MRIINCEQGTPGWFAARKLKMTASHAQAIAANGKGLETYIHKLCAEYYSSGEAKNYTNPDMERGKELEKEAREAYELLNGVTVEQVGFCQFDEYSGFSPDGFIGDNRGLEIKCIDDISFLRHMLYGKDEIDTGHIWQMQMSMLCSGRQYWDYALYNPNFKTPLIVFPFEKDFKNHEALTRGLESGKQKIINIKNKMENYNG